MKISSLIATFLYQHKTLHLQGIGSFMLDNSIYIEEDEHKQNPDEIAAGIQFESNPSTKEDPALIDYIATATGKMKALASADLNSHLELARQFMNIGKPFHFEGIGNLIKTAPGKFALLKKDITDSDANTLSAATKISTISKEEPVGGYKSILYRDPKKMNLKKPILFLFAVAGIGLAIWGGYAIYSKNKNKKPENVKAHEKSKTKQRTTPIKKQTETIIASTDSVATKFILEVTHKQRAFQRFEQLKTYNWNLKMETKDSTLFTLYLLLPVKAADTTQVLDSLSILYGKQVTIAH